MGRVPNDANKSLKNHNNATYVEYLCGAVASSTNVILTYPVSKIVFRQMLYGIRTSPAFKQIRYEGILSLYRGVLPPLIQKTASISLMFGAYDSFLNSYYKSNVGSSHLFGTIIAALLAGTLEASLFTPLERVQTLLQHPNLQHKFHNTIYAMKKLPQVYGWPELFRGLTPILLRNGPATVLFFTFRDPLKKALSPPRNYYNTNNSKYSGHYKKIWETLADFGSGAILGGLISTVFYPINVIRTQMQSTVGGPFTSLLVIAKAVYKERGNKILAFFYGARFNFSRSLLSWGIINTMYELVKKLL